jgi:hypothetical protein
MFSFDLAPIVGQVLFFGGFRTLMILSCNPFSKFSLLIFYFPFIFPSPFSGGVFFFVLGSMYFSLFFWSRVYRVFFLNFKMIGFCLQRKKYWGVTFRTREESPWFLKDIFEVWGFVYYYELNYKNPDMVIPLRE